jgi:hypothetical protein
MKWFCPNCDMEGVAAKKEGKSFMSECSDCAMVVRIEVVREPLKSYDDMTRIFEQIPLTDYQRTGRANTGKWARKKK